MKKNDNTSTETGLISSSCEICWNRFMLNYNSFKLSKRIFSFVSPINPFEIMLCFNSDKRKVLIFISVHSIIGQSILWIVFSTVLLSIWYELRTYSDMGAANLFFKQKLFTIVWYRCWCFRSIGDSFFLCV